MKKVLILVAVLFGVITMDVKAKVELPPKTDHEVVKIYLFYSTTCSHCHDFLEYFQKNYKDEYKDYFEIVALEASNKANAVILNSVRERLDVDSTGVPLIVIGDFNQVGFGSDGTEIIEEALKQYQNESYKDIVEEIISDSDVEDNVNLLNFEKALVSVGLQKVDNDSALPDGVYVAIIFAVLALGIGGLVYLARK